MNFPRFKGHQDFHSAPQTSRSTRIVILVRLYAHYAKASFLHKFAQVLQSGDHGR